MRGRPLSEYNLKAKLNLEHCRKRGDRKHFRQSTCVKACRRGKKKSKKSKYESDPALLSIYISYKSAEKEVARGRKMAPETSGHSHSPISQ